MSPNRNGGSKFITVLNVGPGVVTYIVTPAHVAIHERDNAKSFAFRRSEPNGIPSVLKHRHFLSGLFIDGAHFAVLSFRPILLRQEEQRVPRQKRSSRKSCLEGLI